MKMNYPIGGGRPLRLRLGAAVGLARTIPAILFVLFCTAIVPDPVRAGETGSPKKEPVKPDWEKVFPRDRILDIHLEVSGEDWERLPRRPFEYVPAGFLCAGFSFPSVGLRVKGNSSATVRNERKSLKIDFNRFDKSRRFHGVAKLNLHNSFHDPTMMREYLAYGLFRAAGVRASRVGFARVFITIPGRFEKKYLGLYVNVEQVNGTFLRDRYGRGAGNLWKGEGGSDFTYFGEDPERYGGYELKRNENRGDYSRLIEFVRLIDETPDGSFGDVIEKHLDVEEFLATIAVNTLLANLDSPIGLGHNFYIYHDPESDRFSIIPWDLNLSFGTFRFGSARDMETMSVKEPYAGDKILYRRVLSVKRFRDRYRQILQELLDGPFSPEALAGEIDRLYRLIHKAVGEDKLKEYPMEVFRKSLESDIVRKGPRAKQGGILGLKSFVKNRGASARAQLKGLAEGVKPKSREMRGRDPGSGSIRSGAVLFQGHLYMLSPEGDLSRLAVASMVAETGGAIPKARSAGKGTGTGFVDAFLRKLDRDGDGRVSESEFRGPKDLFRRVDRDRNGFLDRKEIPTLETSSGRKQGRAREREMTICAGAAVIAVLGQNTLYAFDAESMKYVGHNRFGRPVGTHFERRGEMPGPPPPPRAVCEGDTIWILTEDKVLRIDLKALRVRADEVFPRSPMPDVGRARLKMLDRNGNGVVDLSEFRGPLEQFKRADRNRDRVLDRREVADLPPMPGEKPPPEERRLYLLDGALLAVVGDTLLRFDRKELKLLGTTRLRKGK